MAAALIQKIEDNILSCRICSGRLYDPVGLPCLHTFCFKCLDQWFKCSQDKTKVTCPTCKISFPKPKEGIRGFPGHFMVKNLKNTVDLEKKEQTCNMCEKKVAKHCIDCNKSLCHTCLRNHDAFTKDHKVVTIEEYMQSEQVTDEGRFCQVHGKKVKYYCETEERGVCNDCVGLKTCSHNHHRVSLKEAAEKQKLRLKDEVIKCTKTKAQYQDAVDKTKTLQYNLTQSKKQTINCLDKLEKDYNHRVQQAFKEARDKVNSLAVEKNRKIDGKLLTLELELCQIESACDQVSKVQSSVSEYMVTHRYKTLSTTLATINQLQPSAADKKMVHLRFEPSKMEVPPIGSVLHTIGTSRRWILRRRFVTKGLNRLGGIATDDNGDVVVSSWETGIKVYTNQGQLKSTEYASSGVSDVAVLSDNRRVFNPLRTGSIQCNGVLGNKLFTTYIGDVKNDQSNVNSIAVDSMDRIIVGQVGNSISVHHADGSLISTFATEFTPLRLAVTSDEEIVASCYDYLLQKGTSVVLMDYSGGNIRVLQPPAEVKVWRPGCVCCKQGEIFVVNQSSGDPSGVYRYTSDGNYLGCVTTEVIIPAGIDLSDDGMELYVAECEECVIKIFTRVY